MEFIHKLPFILGASMAIIIGMLSNSLGVKQQDTYLRMAVSMISFYIIGSFARKTITKIIEEIENKRQEEAIRLHHEKHEAERAEEERIKEETARKQVGTKLDLKADDYGEDFSPFTVSEYIDSKSQN